MSIQAVGQDASWTGCADAPALGPSGWLNASIEQLPGSSRLLARNDKMGLYFGFLM